MAGGEEPTRFGELTPTLHILGAGQQGRVLADVAMCCWPGRSLQFWDDDTALQETEVMGIPVRGTVAQLAILPKDEVIVAIGDNRTRLAFCRQLLAQGHNLATIIHPAATVGHHVSLGAGSCVLAGAVVQTGARLGLGCLVNTLAAVEHDAVLTDGVHVAGRAYVGPGCQLAEGAFVGAGAVLLPQVNMGVYARVGAGAVVTHSVPAGELWVGVPARRRC